MNLLEPVKCDTALLIHSVSSFLLSTADVLAVMGPSGAGKVNLLATL